MRRATSREDAHLGVIIFNPLITTPTNAMVGIAYEVTVGRLECPASFVPVELIQTGNMKGLKNLYQFEG
jgi:hypothetical protein